MKKSAKFDVRKFLTERIREIVKEYSRTACVMVTGQWSRYDVNGEAEIGFAVEKAQEIVTAAIVANGMKAWLLEFGKGSLMETDREKNPFLDEYISGNVTDITGDPLFNPARKHEGMTILGRPKGVYLDIDDNIHVSSGFMEGWNLERREVTMGGVIPFRPMFIIRKILLGENDSGGLIQLMNKDIADAFYEVLSRIFVEFPKEIVLYKTKG